MDYERHRFKASPVDYRPVKFPPPGPYWCSGFACSMTDENDEYSIVVAYLPVGELVTDWWPEAEDIESKPVESITFTDRFPKPAWWKG